MHSKYSGRAVSLLVFLPMILTGQRAQESVVPLRNWATPLYWQPNQAEREAAARAVPQLQFSANAVSTSALTFVAITPCRLVDTRGAAIGFNGIAPFSGPAIPAAGTVTIAVQSASEATANTMPAPCGVIPSIAQAYSFNVTVVPAAGGSVGYLTLWPAGSPQPVVATLNDSQGLIVANAAIIPAGTPSGAVSVYNAGPAVTDVVIDMNGYFAAPTDGSLSTAVGAGALASNTTGGQNTATGVVALQLNTTGDDNTAIGATALQLNTTGIENTASGSGALARNTTGNLNTASGQRALINNTTGNDNTAYGEGAMMNNFTGSNNIAIGYQAAYNVSNGNNNIHIGHSGSPADTNTIRIGAAQSLFFAAGIRGITTSIGDAIPVVIDSNGQLGTVSSSQRFKEDIEDMGEASSGLLRLRPVTFRYKQPYQDGSKPIDYGLIAEEVSEVYPDLALKGADGQVETVQYQKLTPMLLNELQKQHREMETQKEENRKLAARVAALEALLSGN